MLKENLIRLYEQSFREHHDLTALSDYFKKESFSYFEMAEEIAKLHLLFKECNIQKGDKVALIGRNNPRWVIAYIATITYGAVIVPILQDFNANDVNHIINHSESKIIFLSDNFWDIIEEDLVTGISAAFSLTDYGCIYERNGSTVTEFQKNREAHFKEVYPNGFTVSDIKYPEVGNDEVCLLNYTSGTTGFSKGVMLTVNNLTMQVVFCLPAKRHVPGSNVLAFLPLAHAYGCAVDMLCPLAAGSHVTLLGKIPSPKILVEALQAVKPLYICSVPLVLEKVIKKQIFPMLGHGWLKLAVNVPLLDSAIYSTIRKKLIDTFGGNFYEFIIGGAPLNKEVEEFLTKIKFPAVVGYGMTECGPLISYIGYAEGYVPGSAGRLAIPYVEAKICSSDPKNIPGEILVRGENVMKGYYKNPELTAEVIDKDGWLHTGDMGTIDDDFNIYIRGRCKTMILRGNGQNIYPEEIESKLNNMPYVLESLIVERGDKLWALVVPDYDQLDRDGISHDELEHIMEGTLKELNDQVSVYEHVAGFTLRPSEFEKTPKKSIKRFLYTA